MKRAAVEPSRSGPRQPRRVGPDQRVQDGVDRRAAAAFFLRRLQFVEPLAVGRKAAGDEQLRDQFVLGAEMIIHRGEVHVRFRDDVAQRHVAEAAIGVKPFGGGKDGGPGLIARHALASFRHSGRDEVANLRCELHIGEFRATTSDSGFDATRRPGMTT